MVRTILKETVFDKKAKINRTNNAEFATRTKESMVQAEAEIKVAAISVKDFKQGLVKEDKIYKATEPAIEVKNSPSPKKFSIEEITIGEL